MRLDTLEPGTRFRTRAKRTGALLRLTSGAALVRYDTQDPLRLGDGTALLRPAETVTISRATEVKTI